MSNADKIFDTYNDIPFLHRHHYERVKLDVYIERYGDINGIAARVLRNLVDLLPIVQQCVALPLPSYSLKLVEKHVGFHRSQTEYGGTWAMAKYIESIETHDENLRQDIVDQIRTYNQEDLAATWAVFEWLRHKFPASPAKN